MTPTRVSIAAAGVAVLALLVIGLVQLHGSSSAPARPLRLSLAQMRAELAGSPGPLAALHSLAGLHGQPVVVNKWASWCVPCHSELGAFQRVSLALGQRVAFIGIDSGESRRGDGVSYLRSYPLSYPSYEDQSGQTGRAITDSSFTPVTVFYDRRGGQYIHQGPYPSEAKLEQDVKRYALGA